MDLLLAEVSVQCYKGTVARKWSRNEEEKEKKKKSERKMKLKKNKKNFEEGKTIALKKYRKLAIDKG